MERFFDESGGTQLVIHAPFGSRVNRAWGLALRKRFCRTFNFELQAAATEDAIVLSLTGSHSFALDEVWRYLHSNSAEHLLIQALLDAPLFGVRWRWNATNALALPRYTGGRKVAPQLQRMKSEDLLASVFPDQVACLENVVGEREVPQHPLVEQTIDDCLHDAMDSDALARAAAAHRSAARCGSSRAICPRRRRSRPRFCRRGRMRFSTMRRSKNAARRPCCTAAGPIRNRADDLGALDADAIDERARRSVARRAQRRRNARGADEPRLHHRRRSAAQRRLARVARRAGATPAARRACRSRSDDALWMPVERLTCVRAALPRTRRCTRRCTPPDGLHRRMDRRRRARRNRARAAVGLRPADGAARSRGRWRCRHRRSRTALTRLEAEGYVMRGRFTPRRADEEWCERHLLARIHRYTVRRLRREIEPVERQDFMRFLFEWQHLAAGHARRRPRRAAAPCSSSSKASRRPPSRGKKTSCRRASRIIRHTGSTNCAAPGKIVWSAAGADARARRAARCAARRSCCCRAVNLAAWSALMRPGRSAGAVVARATRVRRADAHGAMFFDELLADVRLLRTELENALGELVALGLVNADSFAGLRALLAPAAKRNAFARRPRRGGMFIGGMDDAGRWALLRRAQPQSGRARGRTLGRTRRDDAAAPLWRRVLAPARTRGRLAAAVARPAARVSSAGSARRDSRRALRRAGWRASSSRCPKRCRCCAKCASVRTTARSSRSSAVDPLNLVGTLAAGREGAGARGQSRAVSRRRAGRRGDRGQDALSAASSMARRAKRVRLRLVKRSARSHRRLAPGAAWRNTVRCAGAHPFRCSSRRHSPAADYDYFETSFLWNGPGRSVWHARNGNARIIEQPVSARGGRARNPGCAPVLEPPTIAVIASLSRSRLSARSLILMTAMTFS